MSTACLGIDHSKWQWGKPLPWKALRERDVKFSIAKSTQNRYVDPFFKRAHYEAKEEGFVRGVYTWIMPDSDVVAAADFFVDTIKDFDDVLVCVDFEEPKTVLRGRALVERCEIFCRRVEELTSKYITLYTGTWYYVGYCENADSEYLASRALWHAQYPRLGTDSLDYLAALDKLRAYKPKLSHPWHSRSLRELFFQFDGDGGLFLPNGVDADFNIFHGSESDLVALAAERITAPSTGYKPEMLDARTFDPMTVNEVLAAIAEPGGLDSLAARLGRLDAADDVFIRSLGSRVAHDAKLMALLSNSA